MLSIGGASYQYDGLNNRVQQTVGANVTKYLLDLQPGLAVVLSETTGANTVRNVHSLSGIHAHKDAAGAWEWMMQDGLGSVRGVVDNSVGVLESRLYDPYGVFVPYGSGSTGSSQTIYGFTGEPTDSNGLLHLRARYYNPAAGVFTALDPFEGLVDRPMSLNGYSYVVGNPVNFADPTGLAEFAKELGVNEGIGGGGVGNISYLNISWQGPTLYGSWNPAGTGATGIAPISGLTWTQSTFGPFINFQGLGLGWTTPQGDYIGLDTLSTANYLNGAMCPNLSLANQSLVIESLQAQQQQQAQQQADEDEESPKSQHIALGRGGNDQLKIFINQLRFGGFVSSDVNVTEYGDWETQGFFEGGNLGDNPILRESFAATFAWVMGLVKSGTIKKIHFNLQNLMFPDFSGWSKASTEIDKAVEIAAVVVKNGGVFTLDGPLSASELWTIGHDAELCQKTDFYLNGYNSQIAKVDNISKMQTLCNPSAYESAYERFYKE